MDEGMIPIAVDYGCDTGKCSGKFKPLDSSYSYDAKDVLNLMMDPQVSHNILKKYKYL
jgi:hypothetical protein